MKKSLIFFAVFLFSVSLFAQSGKVMDNLSMPSKILKGDRKYAVYLPPDYETSQRSYPVMAPTPGRTGAHHCLRF